MTCLTLDTSDFPPGPGRLPIVGSYLSIPQTNGVFVAATRWFISRYGKLVSHGQTALRMRRHAPLPLGGALRRQRPRGHLLRLRGGQGAAEPGRHHRPPTVLRIQVQNAGRQARASVVCSVVSCKYYNVS